MKTRYLFPILILTILGISSCATERSSTTGYSYNDAGGASSFGQNEYYKSDDDRDYTYPKKVIYSSTIDLTVKIPDTANVQIGAIAKKYNGYVQQCGTSTCVIRVEEKFLKNAMDDISLLGKVERKSSYGEDVTAQYSDYAIRLENAEKSRLRYLELLEKAENVQAALLVEKELERLNETIELMKGQMNRIDHLSAYSTITIYLKEKPKPGIIGYIGIGIFKSIKWLFVRN